MITYNMTAREDKDLVWLFRIKTDQNTYYIGTAEVYDEITLATYSGDVIGLNSVSGTPGGLDPNSKKPGGIGGLSSLTFKIAQTGDSGLRNYKEDFFPNGQSAERLIHAKVELMFIWQNGTPPNRSSTPERNYYVKKVTPLGGSGNEYIEVYCIEDIGLQEKSLPLYTVQKEYDNGISYYPTAPQNSIGKTIPIVYGKFPSETPSSPIDFFNLCPAIAVERSNLEYKIASHPVNSLTSYQTYEDATQGFYLYDGGLNSVVRIYTDYDSGNFTSTITESNTAAGSSIKLYGSGVGQLVGDVYVSPSSIGQNSDVRDQSFFDKDDSTYGVIPHNQKATFSFSNTSLIDLGASQVNANQVTLNVTFKSSDGTSRSYKIDTYNTKEVHFIKSITGSVTTLTTTGFVVFNNLVVLSDELRNSEFYVVNQETTSGKDIWLYEVYLRFRNIFLSASTLNTLANQSESYIDLIRQIGIDSPFFPDFFPKGGDTTGNAFVEVEGMTFREWIDDQTNPNDNLRVNGFNEGDLIRQPSYQIESFIREFLMAERDLKITSYTTPSAYRGASFADITIDSLNNDLDASRYTYAILNNPDADQSHNVQNGFNDVFVAPISEFDTDSTGDNAYLVNIERNRYDTDSIDYLGNTTNGLKKDWKFDWVLAEPKNSLDILDQMGFESHTLIGFRGSNVGSSGITLKPLDTLTSVGTLGTPLHSKSEGHLFDIDVTSTDQIYTSFEFNYAYSHQSKRYTKAHYVNKEATSDSALDGYKTNCVNASKRFKIERPYVVNLDFIQDSDTCIELMKKLILWFTDQRMIVRAVYEWKDNGVYEKGDQVKINFLTKMPSNKNDSAIFIVADKVPIFTPGGWGALYTLLELVN